jgi:hypothetical protein
MTRRSFTSSDLLAPAFPMARETFGFNASRICASEGCPWAAAGTTPTTKVQPTISNAPAEIIPDLDLRNSMMQCSALSLPQHDWARFGEFLRLGGRWNGQQLLSPGFVDYMRSPAPASDEGHGPVYGRGQLWLAQGLGFALPADTFMLNGYLRQTITIIPSRKLVILRMGLTREDIGYSNAKLLHAIVAAGF